MKHPLLPDSYLDASMHAAILSSLAPYERIADSKDPHFKWDLTQAWQDAEHLLRGARWRHRGDDGDAIDLGWEMTADTEEEKEHLHTIVAGIVAHQIENPDSRFSIRRVDYRKGGEVGLIISSTMQKELAKQFPQAHYERI